MMLNPVLLIAIPLGLAFISVIFSKVKAWFLVVGTIACSVLVFFVESGETAIGGFRLPFAISLVVDDYTMIAVATVNILLLAVLAVSYKKASAYSTVLLAGLAGLNGMVMTGDLFNLFVFMEITAISAYIISSEGKKPEKSFNYLVIGSIGSVLYLLGLILLYGIAGTLNMAEMSEMIPGLTATAVILPVFLIFLGISVEAKLLPMSGWVRGVLGNSNSFTGPILATVYSSAALFVFGRLFSQILVMEKAISTVIVIIALITFISGQAAAFRSRSIRKVLLFSSIAQAGLAAALFVTGFVFPAVLVIVNNAIGKFVMFATAGRLDEEYGTDDYIGLRGAFCSNIVAGSAFTISALSITGIPLLFGFYAKLNVLAAYLNQGTYFVPAVILAGTVIEAAYFIRIIIRLWAPGREGEQADASESVGARKIFSFTEGMAVVIAALLIILSGILPDSAGKLIGGEKGLLGDEGPVISMTSMKGDSE